MARQAKQTKQARTQAQRALTARQQVFVERYLTHWNASRAAREAGYAEPANMSGPRLLANDSIQKLIKARLDELRMGADETLALLAEIARADLGQFIDVETFGRPVVTLTEDISDGVNKAQTRLKPNTRLLKKITVTDDSVSIEGYSRLEALGMIGKAHGLFKDRAELTGAGGSPVRVEVTSKPDLTRLSDEELQTLASILKTATSAQSDS